MNSQFNFGLNKPTFIVAFGGNDVPVADAVMALKGTMKAVKAKGREPVLYTASMGGNPLFEAMDTVCLNSEDCPCKVWSRVTDMMQDLRKRDKYAGHVICVILGTPDYMGSDEVQNVLANDWGVNMKTYLWSAHHHTWVNGKGTKQWVRTVFLDIIKKIHNPRVSVEDKKAYAVKRFLHLMEYSRKSILQPVKVSS